jgi:hypothetical protein
MDKRCPLQLDSYPECWCPLSVAKLKSIRHSDKELSEQEEDKLPGCKWHINSQMANYCFFDFADKFIPNKTEDRVYSDIEIAHFLGISVDTVRKIEKRALQKVRNYPSFKEIIDRYKGTRVLDEKSSDVEFDLDNL